MQCFYVACREYPATIGMLTGGFLLTAFGSPLGTLMTAKDSHADLFPSLQRGFYLNSFRKGIYFTDLKLARSPESALILNIDPEALDDDDAVAPGEGPFAPRLLRATPVVRDGKVWLTGETDDQDDQDKALVAVRVGLGTADYLDYKTGQTKILLQVPGDDSCLLAVMAKGDRIIALRSRQRWWNKLGFKHRSVDEEIHISFDGEKLEVRKLLSGQGR